MPQAISYLRFSTRKQLSGDSKRRQSQLIKAWLQANPSYQLSDVHYEDLGISGYSGANSTSGAFGEFLQAVESGLIEPGTVLLVESLDRVSRQDIDSAGEQLRKILRTGVEVVTLADNSWYTKESLRDTLSMIKALLVMERAHEESQRKSERLRAVWAAKREAAKESGKILSQRCVAWLKVSDDKTCFELIPDNVKAVQRVFELRLEGLSHVAIARRMNDEGFFTLNQYKPVKSGWSQTTVTELLSNRAVIGDKMPSKSAKVKSEPLRGYYPAVVEESVFYAVQQLKVSSSGRRPSSDKAMLCNLFKGVMRCKACGNIMLLSGATDKRHGNYRCSKKSEGRCSAPGISRKQADESLIQGLLYNSDVLNLYGNNGKELGKLQGEAEEIQKKRDRLLQLAEMTDDIETIAPRVKELNQQLKEVNSQIAAHQQREAASDGTDTFIRHLDLTLKADKVKAQLVVKRLIKSIEMDTVNRCCDITFHNGLRFTDYPLNRVVDGGTFLEVLPLIDGDGFDFRGYGIED